MKDKIVNIIKNSIEVKEEILTDIKLINTIDNVTSLIVECFNNDGKVLFCGNGGSAADAQHLAAELSGKFYFDRAPLFAEALHVNTSYLTAVANDYSYDMVFSRLVQAMGKKNDILIGLSTSGNSQNIIKAFMKAKSLSMKTVAFTGQYGNKVGDLSDYLINVPSLDTPRIQESHILI